MRRVVFLTLLLLGMNGAAWSAETPQVVTTDLDGIWVFTGNGDGTFGNGVFYFVGSGVEPWHLLAVDVDGDGLRDVVSANRYGPSIAVFINTGDGFADPAIYRDAGSIPYATAAGDFDGDGDLDLAVANPVAGGVVVLMENQGDGTFVRLDQLYLGDQTYGVTSGDLDTDGIIDLIVVNSGSNNILAMRGIGDGTFELASTLTAQTNPKDAAIGYFNEDDLPDIAVVNYDSSSVTVFINDGDLFFDPGRSYPVGSGIQPRNVQVADLDEDGFEDLIIAGGRNSNQVFVLYGEGGDDFTAAVGFQTGPRPNSVAVADVNGDARLDILAANWSLDAEENASVSVLAGVAASRSFTKVQDFKPPQGFAKVTFVVADQFKGVTFLRGDVNEDSVITVSDPVLALRFMFGLKSIDCPDAADANDDGSANVADVITLLRYLFAAGRAPKQPFPTAGVDPTADSLSCAP
jgi:hypothetical protein